MFSFTDIDQVANLGNHLGKISVVLGFLATITTGSSVYLNHVKQELQVAKNRQKEEDSLADKNEKKRLSDELAETKKSAKDDRDARLALESKVEAGRKGQAQIEQAMAPRHLTAGQITAIANTLKAYRPSTVSIVAPMGQAEAISYANEIKSAIESGGWKVSGVDQAMYTPSIPSGLYLQVRSFKAIPSSADGIATALQNAKFTGITREEKASLPPEITELLVGIKAQ